MSATALTIPQLRVRRGFGRVAGAVHDTFAVAVRNLIAYKRVPQLLVFSSIQPVIFVLMFRYVFGGAIHIPGVPYVDYLMPGIFVQTVVFGSSAFVSVSQMPGWLQPFANHQPVSVTTSAIRALVLGGPTWTYL